MRILQICFGFVPRQSARNGGELRYWQNLSSLVALGHDVHLALCCVPSTELQPGVVQLPASVHVVESNSTPVTRLESWHALFSNGAAFTLALPQLRGRSAMIQQVIEKVRPELIWADWIGSLALVPMGLVPVVYGHTDFYYKIRSVRSATRRRKRRWPDRIRDVRQETAELAFCKKADHVVCASHSEKQQMNEAGRVATYIPIVGPDIPKPAAKANRGRVYLFGNWGNTAMRHSARHLHEQLWPLLEHDPPPLEWHQVGSPEPQKSEVWEWIERHFVCHGFVPDLSSVFRIGDASFIPYTEDTGFRTKFVTAAGYGLVNIGYEQTFRCAPEFTSGKNCLMARSPEEMVTLLHRYAEDAELRHRLGEAARALYEQAFSFEAQLPKYKQVLEQVMNK